MDTFLKYVINLPERLDRRKEMEAQLRRIGWQAQFIAAAKPSAPDGFPSIGSRGCFLSHLEALRQGAPSNEHIVLMEDDLNFIPDFQALWREASKTLFTKDWSVFYAGHTLKHETNGLSLIPSTDGIVCAHFMMINRSAVRPLIQGLETILSRPPGHPLGGPMHVDGAYSTIRAQNPQFATYAFSPSLGYQRSSRSDIASPRFFDRIPVLRPVVSRLRQIKQALR
jgi:glycosyl transferase, family 25